MHCQWSAPSWRLCRSTTLRGSLCLWSGLAPVCPIGRCEIDPVDPHPTAARVPAVVLEVAATLAQWLLLPPPGTPPLAGRLPCAGCGVRLAPLDVVDHLHACRRLRRRAVTLRHDLLTSRFATTLQCVNAVTRVEPRSFGQTSRSRPDIAVYRPTSSPHLSPSQLLDVTYVHIPAPTYRLRSPAAVLQARATQKSTKYAALAATEGAAFFPLVVATSGGLSKATMTYLKRVSKHLGHFHRPSTGRLMYFRK